MISPRPRYHCPACLAPYEPEGNYAACPSCRERGKEVTNEVLERANSLNAPYWHVLAEEMFEQAHRAVMAHGYRCMADGSILEYHGEAEYNQLQRIDAMHVGADLSGASMPREAERKE